MITSRLSTARRLGHKAINVAPLVARDPHLLQLMRQGVHPEQYTRLNMTWLRESPPTTILDIGANTGQFTGAAKALFPHATIFAFEPQQECYNQIVDRFGPSGGVHAIHTAVGDEDGETTFHQNAFSQSSSVLEMTALHRESFPWAAESTTVQVPIRRLDSIAQDLQIDSPVLVKIDVQGYEDRVLRGGEQTIRAANVVLIETSFEPLYKGEASFATVYELMSSYGFRYAGNLDQVNNPKDDRPLYADALFLRNR